MKWKICVKNKEEQERYKMCFEKDGIDGIILLGF